MSTYGAQAAKSQNDSAPWRCSRAAMPNVSVTMPVTLLAAENDPILSGRSACFSSSAASRSWSMWPSASSRMVTTSAIDSRHGSSLEWCSKGPVKTTGRSARRDQRHQVVAVVELGRDPQPEDADQLVDGGGAAGAGEDHRGGLVAADVVADQAAGVLAQPRGLQPGAAGLGVGVGVAGQDLMADEVLDEAEAASRRRVVGVRDATRSVGSGHHLVVADDRRPDPFEQWRCSPAGSSRHCSHGMAQQTPLSVLGVSHVRAGSGRNGGP